MHGAHVATACCLVELMNAALTADHAGEFWAHDRFPTGQVEVPAGAGPEVVDVPSGRVAGQHTTASECQP